MALGVYCECGQTLPVAENDAGSALMCSCGRRVVVPLLEEFTDGSILLSASSIERRVRRLIAEGLLPSTDACLRCGDGAAESVAIDLQCERYAARATGGQRFLIIPFLWGFFWTAWREPEGLEIRGRDTDVPTPVGLCADCWNKVRAPPASWYMLLTALLLAASGVVGYLNRLAGIGCAVIGLSLMIAVRSIILRRWQSMLKQLLRKVPVYRQVLKRYSRAVVVIPKAGPDRTRRPT
jgi:hypothetical protein